MNDPRYQLKVIALEINSEIRGAYRKAKFFPTMLLIMSISNGIFASIEDYPVSAFNSFVAIACFWQAKSSQKTWTKIAQDYLEMRQRALDGANL